MIKYFKLLFLVLITILNSCFDNNPSANFILDKEVVVIINDEKVTSKQFKKVLIEQKKIFKVQNIQELKPEELSWFKNRVLDEVVKNILLLQEIAKTNITINQNELDEALKQKGEGYIEGTLEKALQLHMVKILPTQYSSSIT